MVSQSECFKRVWSPITAGGRIEWYGRDEFLSNVQVWKSV